MIVGGGPAGVSTWLHLNKFAPELAERTVLIEKEKYPRDKLCGGAVSGWSEIVFKNLDVELSIPSIWIENVEFHYGRNINSIYQTRFFRVVQRQEFDHELAKIATKRGLELRENEEFLDITRSKEYLKIKTNLDTYKIKVLVGADGSLSVVRKRMNLPNKPHLAPTLEVFAPANPKFDKEVKEKKIVIDMTPQDEGLQGYVWHVPSLKNKKPIIGHGMVDFRFFPERPRADMKKIFSRVLQSREIYTNINLWRGHPIRYPSKNDIVSKPNILLVGDAIGIEPAFGGGIHFALSYGEIAAKTIINAFECSDFSFENYKQEIQFHLLGKWLKKCTDIASGLYGKKIHPFDAARDIFTIEDK
ncbi:MAG: hypothetical protein DRO67_09800 [Candidatus Asgardarchaeum californiense]|nr:MAG: hypothetical protein DRO67_09800 [Candidatus Asgardarchaeum californiense]